MTNFKAKIKYQSGRLNVLAGIVGPLVVREAEAVTIAEGTVNAENVWEACEKIFVNMNNPNIVLKYQDQCKKIGHSSMMVGDYIEFEGHEGIYIAAQLGFVNLNKEEIARAI